MKILFHRRFEKQYKKLPVALQEKTKKAIKMFIANAKYPSLKNHALKGRMKGLRAFTVTGNVRVVFQEQEGYVSVIFLSIGGHEMVYH